MDHIAGSKEFVWRARFATVSKLTAVTVATLSRHTGGVTAVAPTEVDGRPVVVTGGGDGTVRIWDLAEQRALRDPVPPGYAVNAMAVAQLDDRPVVVTGDDSGTVRVWDLVERRALGDWSVVKPRRLTEHELGMIEIGASVSTTAVSAMATAQLDGRPILVTVTGSHSGDVQAWDLAEQRALGDDPFASTDWTHKIAVTELNGNPIAIVGNRMDGTIRVWDLRTQRPLGDLHIDHDRISAATAAEVDGRPVVVTGGVDGLVRVRELAGQSALGDQLTGHPSKISAVAAAEVDGRLVAITIGRGAIGVWDVAERRALSCWSFGLPFKSSAAVAVAQVDGRPVAVTATSNGIGPINRGNKMVQVWDLAELCAHGDPLTRDNDSWVYAMTAADGLPRVFRTRALRLIHAAACPFRYSSRTSCGVR